MMGDKFEQKALGAGQGSDSPVAARPRLPDRQDPMSAP